jgi:hypothetical protein
MKAKVYVETTIPSFYHETRSEPDMVARRQWTQQWWESASDDYELVTSIAVLEELAQGDYSSKNIALEMMSHLPLVEIQPQIIGIVQTYIRYKVMPNDPAGDALHLALASYHKCDFLLTWNCNHLANANKFGHIRQVNTLLGLYVPALVTPLELLGGSNEAEG